MSAISGEVAPLPALCAMAAKSNAIVLIDETFSAGALGICGGGLYDLYRNQPTIDVLARFADLSIAFAGFGCTLTASQLLVELIVKNSRTLAKESPIPAFLCGAMASAVDFVQAAHATRERIMSLASRLRSNLLSSGIRTIGDSNSHIVSIRLAKPSSAEELADGLASRGFFVEAVPIRLPLSQSAVLRAIIASNHNQKQIDELSESISDIFRRLEISTIAS